MTEPIHQILFIIGLFAIFFWSLIVNSGIIFGLFFASDYKEDESGKIDEDSKQLLWRFKYYSKKIFGDYWCRPFICCPVCMASVHSLWIWLPVYVMTGLDLHKLFAHCIYMLFLVALNKYLMIKYEMD